MKPLSGSASFLLVFAALTLVRWPIAHVVPSGGPAMMDELSLTLAGLDRFLAAPLTNTHWPGLINQLLAVPVISADFLWHCAGRPGPDELVSYLSAAYREPWHVLVLSRLTAIAVCCAGFSAVAVGLARRSGIRWAPFLAVALLATVPLLWNYSCENTGEATALGFGCLAVAAALSELPATGRAAVAGACLGLALAGRNTFAPFTIAVAALLWSTLPERRLKSLGLFGLAAVLGWLLACPAVWLEPVRFAKANLGNYRKTGTPVGWSTAAEVAANAAPAWFWLLALSCTVAAAFARRWALIIATCAPLLLLIAAAAHSPFVQPHYFLSGVLAAGLPVAAAATLPPIAVFAHQRPWLTRLAGLGLAVAVVVLTFSNWQNSRQRPAAFLEGARALREHLIARPHRRIAVPFEYLHHTASLATNASFARMQARLEDALQHDAFAAYVSAFGFPARVARGLASNFNEKDAAFAARLRVMRESVAPGTAELYFTGDAAYAARNGLLAATEAQQMLATGQLDEVVTTTSTSEAARQLAPGLFVLGTGAVEGVAAPSSLP